MVVVAIIGILAAIAIPSYSSYIVKSNRASAKAFMLTVANKQEQILLDARQYATAAANANFGANLNISVPTEVSQYYNMAVANVGGNPRTFRITAIPIPGKAQANDGTLTLDNTGTKTPADKW